MTPIEILNRRPKGRVMLLAALSAALVASLDYATGTEISFSIFYLIPVSLLAWFYGKREGLSGAALCAFLWYGVERLGGVCYSHDVIPVWNALVRASFFAIVAAALAEMRKAYQLEKTTSELKSDMLSDISREFGNSLLAIRTTACLLRETDDSRSLERRQALYDGLERIHADMGLVVENFAGRVEREAGRSLRREAVLLRELIQGTLSYVKPLANFKRLTLMTEFPRQPITVRADRGALVLVMSNLLENAVKYTQEGGLIHVGISADPSRGALPGWAMIWVEDNGIGISKDERMKILSEEVYRGDEARKTAKGYGIGLKVVREMILAHGGELELDGEPGKGTRARFRLPVVEEGPDLGPPGTSS